MSPVSSVRSAKGNDMPIKKLILFLVLLAAAILFVAYLAMDNRENPGTAVNLPPLEASFIDVVSRAQDDSQKAENDMQKGGIKAKRDTALCNVMTTLQVNDWIGTIEKIDSNSDGKGVLEISIAHGIMIYLTLEVTLFLIREVPFLKWLRQ
jgi:hypothetical protein